jgi:hypothetical protein
MLSVRLPSDLAGQMPKKNRSAWVVQALRDRLRRERFAAIAQSAAASAQRDLEELERWEPATAPMPERRPRHAARSGARR